jgi:hypothetical protein
MREESRTFGVIKKVVNHCRLLLRCPTLGNDERKALEARLMTEEEALRQMTESVAST